MTIVPAADTANRMRSTLRADHRRPGGVALGVAYAGVVTAVLWVLLTILETDSGSGDAIWRYSSSWKVIAWIATLLGGLAAGTALALARRLRATPSRSVRRWFIASVAAQLILFAAWVAAIYTAPS
jgi:hypothetical protein